MAQPPPDARALLQGPSEKEMDVTELLVYAVDVLLHPIKSRCMAGERRPKLAQLI
jgi:hypothetical protein